MIKQNKVIALVGSNSVHTLKYLNAISQHIAKIIFITNSTEGIVLPDNVIPYSISFKLTNFMAAKQIAGILRQYPIDIVHIQQANSYAYHALKGVRQAKINCKTILTAWGSDVLVLPKMGILFKKIVQFNLNNADIITSVSLNMSAIIKHLAPKVKSVYTIDFGMQNFPEAIDLTIKEDFILSNRLHKKLYNIDQILSAFSKLSLNPIYDNFKLVIAATGTETNTLKQQAENLKIAKRVIFTGMLNHDELILWYQKAKIFVSVPSSDGASQSIREAMSYGCYPVLSNIPANLEVILDEINGTICQDTAHLDLDLSAAIELTKDDPKYTEVATFNYRLIKKKAVFADNLKKFLKLYY